MRCMLIYYAVSLYPVQINTSSLLLKPLQIDSSFNITPQFSEKCEKII